MRKSVSVFVFLLLVNNAALADWKQYGGNALSNAYYDPTSMVITGHIVKVTAMSSFVGASEMSMIVNYKFDCEKKLINPAGLSQMFSKKMGKGKVTSSFNLPDGWSPVENSADKEVEFQLFNLVCATHK